MTIKKKIILGLSAIVIAFIVVVLSMYFKSSRDVQATKTDFTLTVSELVNEYLTDIDKADKKYLDENGNSKVLEVFGTISSISKDFNNQKVILLKESTDKAGVSATFTAETNISLVDLKVGDKVTIKGVIRSGASFDKDLEMYENVILDKCDIIKNKK